MRVIQCFEPRLEQPDRLHLASLAALRVSGAEAIGVVPIADELRRNLDPPALSALLAEVAARHPGNPIRVFVNPANTGSRQILDATLPAGVEVRKFSNLVDLLQEYRTLAAWYGTDTGLYHLAAAMGIPATVFFGPTQPWKIVMPGQPATTWVRMQVLGRTHCEEKSCTRPLCLHQAVASFGRAAPSSSLADTPIACPLRAYPAQALAAITLHENPRHQA